MLRGVFKFFLFFISLIFSLQVHAQINNPFSRFGYGTVERYDFTAQQGIGNISSAFSDHRYINTVNPASYADFYSEQYAKYLTVKRYDSTFVDSATGKSITKTFTDSIYRDTLVGVIKNTSFQTALDLQFNNTLAADANSRSSNGSLGYLALGFPIPKVGGISFGILPYSTVSYNINQTTTIDSIGKVNYNYVGSGGLYQFYTGAGIKYKNLRLGVNVRYIFGSIELQNSIFFNEQNNAIGTRSNTRLSVQGVKLDAGLQYDIDLGNNLNLKLGAFGKLPTNLTAEADTVVESIFYNNQGNTASLDTVNKSVRSSIKSTVPAGFGLGFILEDPTSWMFGVDYQSDFWGGNQGLISSTSLVNSWKLSAGGQFVPNFRGNFLEKINYRLGGFYNKNNMLVKENPIYEYGMTFGIGLPIVRPRQTTYSTIDMSLQVGKMGNINDHGIAENYIKLSVGINMNDNSWIFKSKFY